MVRILVGLVSLATLGGCSREDFDYYYVSLEGVAGIEVVRAGTLDVPNLRGNKSMPIEYLLDREEYAIVFQINNQSYSPHVELSLLPKEMGALEIEPRRNMEVRTSNGAYCSSYQEGGEGVGSSWTFGWSAGCLGQEGKEIVFDVRSADGAIVASERVPFELRKNGKYTLLDAL